MEFRILGPLEVVTEDGIPVELGAAKPRALLGLLLVHANQAVSAEQLIDELWEQRPPRSAMTTLQTYVSQLRKRLGPALETRPTGYRLKVDPAGLDAALFEQRLSAIGRAAEQGPLWMAEQFEEALALWRGPALADFAGVSWAEPEAGRLEGLRLLMIEDQADARLALGQHAHLVPELETLTAAHPLRERFWGQLMVALYRCGRQSEALRAYGTVRRILGDELGIEPAAELVRLEEAILLHKPDLDWSPVPSAEPDWTPDQAPVQPTNRSRASAGRLPVPPQLTTSNAGFVGRSAERARMDNALDAALEGQRQLVFVAGEAGIGKTRLATDIAVRAHARGLNVLYGRCDEDLGVPYQPFVEALTYAVRHCGDQSLQSITGESPGELVRLVPELAKRLPGVAAPIAADPETERYWLLDAVTGWLAAMSTDAPLVLVLDDLHWATTPTLLMLRHVARSQQTMPLLIIGLYRDSEIPGGHPLTGILSDLQREPNVQRVLLAGLDRTAVGALVEEASPHTLDDAGAGLATALHTGTGGNPFYVGEILRSLVETDTLGRQAARGSTFTIDEFALPDSVRDVVKGRMARLTAATNRMLAAAAVAGPTFSLDLLENVPDAADDSAALIDSLDEAVEAAILVDTSPEVGGYSFAHAVIRQVAYRKLSAARRARLHQQVGDALERLPADEGARLSGLAYHFAEAARTPYVDKAVDYALRAGRHALGQLAFEEAITHLERGLRMFELAEDPAETRRAELLLELAGARFQILDRPGVKQAAVEVAQIGRAVGSPELVARGAIACIFVAGFARLDLDVVAICEEALAALEPEEIELRSRVLATLVAHRAAGGEGWRTEALALEAVDLARLVDSPETLAIALWARRNALAGSERAAEELPLAEELIRVANAAGSAVFEFSGHHWRGGCRLALGNIAGFEEDRLALARLSERTHSADIAAQGDIWQASRALLDGRFEDAEGHMAELLSHVGDDPNFLNGYAALLMWLRFEQGRLAEFKDIAVAFVGQYPDTPALRAALAVLHLELAEVDEARAVFDEVVAGDLINVPRDFTWPAMLSFLSEFIARTGSDRADHLYELLLPYHGQILALGNGGACVGAADRYLGMLAMTGSRSELAQRHFEIALELEQGIGSVPLSTRTRYWQARLFSQLDTQAGHERARSLLDEVIECATGLGMGALADQATTTRSSLLRIG